MADVNSSLSTTDTSGITLQSSSVSGSTTVQNDSAYPYSTQDGQAVDPNVASLPWSPYSSTPPRLPKALLALIGPTYVDEANETLAISTKIASVQTSRSNLDLRHDRQRLDAQNARQKEQHEKYVRSFIRAMRHAKSMAGLNLFIKIAAPVAAALVTVGTLGAGAPLAAMLCAYTVASTITSSAGGPNIGLAENTEKGIYAGLMASGEFNGKEKEAHHAAMLGAGAIGALALWKSPELIMSNPELVGKLAQGLALFGTSEENAALIGAVVGAVAGLVAGGRVAKGTASKAAGEGAGAGGGGGGEGVAGEAEDAAEAAAKVAQEALKEAAKQRALMAIVLKYANLGAGGMAAANASAGGAQAGLQYDTALAQRDMSVDQARVDLTKVQIDALLDKMQHAGQKAAANLRNFQQVAEVALQMQQKKHHTTLQIVNGQVGTVGS